MAVFAGPQQSPDGLVFNFDCLNSRCTVGDRSSGIPYKDLVSNNFMRYDLDGSVAFASYQGGHSPIIGSPTGYYTATYAGGGSPAYGTYNTIQCQYFSYGYPNNNIGSYAFTGGAYITSGSSFQLQSPSSSYSNLFFGNAVTTWSSSVGSYPTQQSIYPFAVEFGGTDWLQSDLVDIGSQNEPFSIETIVRSSAIIPDGESIVSLRPSIDSSTYFDISYGIGAGTYQVKIKIGPSVTLSYNGLNIFGSFFHLVATYSGSPGHVVTLYVNGKLATTSSVFSFNLSGSRLFVARDADTSFLSTGDLTRIDLGMLRAYNRALTADEVENAYHATIGKYRT